VSPRRRRVPTVRALRGRLMGLRGREFDRVFVRHMVADHRKDIDEFRDEAREHHGRASALASRQLPTLEKHLHIAQGLEGGFSGRYDQTSDRRWRGR
jgi:predicted outer membrane protein